MYRSWFHTKQSEEEGPTASEASALEDFLGGKLHPSEAAISITNSCSKEDEQEVLPDPFWVFERLWSFMLDAAQQIPDTQDQLVQLVAAIKQLPDLQPDHIPLGGGGWTWADLPYLRELMRDSWNFYDPEPSAQNLVTRRQEWGNLNAFAARLTMARCDDYLIFGFWSICKALEYNYQDSVRTLDGWVPAAARWIFHAGPMIYECQLEIEPSSTGGHPLKGGDLWDGKHGFCKERWSFWKDRFEWVQKNLNVEIETRRTAGEAFASMRRVEGYD